jgi:hypothetical protein
MFTAPLLTMSMVAAACWLARGRRFLREGVRFGAAMASRDAAVIAPTPSSHEEVARLRDMIRPCTHKRSRRAKLEPAVGGSLVLCALLSYGPALAATDEGKEEGHAAVLELGATGEREISERVSYVGPAVGVEVEPIENCLEISSEPRRMGARGPRTGN